MLVLEATRVSTHAAPFGAPLYSPPSFLPTSSRRIRPLPVYVTPPQGIFSHNHHAIPYVSPSSTALHSYAPSIHQVAAAVAAVTPSAATTVSFLRLAIVFVAGGLFFSSAVAAATACYAIGMDNIQRLKEMTKIVWESVWLTFTMGLSSTKQVLMGTRSIGFGNTHQPSLWKRYLQAWKVLRCKLGETRRKAVEGVQAISREVKMCAAAVGPPGLIPLQYMVDHQLHFTIGAGIEAGLKGAIESVQMPNIDLKLSRFDVGATPPKLEAARVYDLGDDAMAFDFDIKWESELKATIQLQSGYLPPKLPVTIHNVSFKGPVRVVMAPLTKSYPGFGATLVSFPSMPEIGLDIRVAGGDVTQVVPMLRAEIMNSIQNSIADSMIWPKRAVVPSYPMDDPTTPILSARELEELKTTDPLLRAEEALGTRPVMKRRLNQMSELLSTDQEVLKSIVDLPMPSFRTDKTEERKEKGETIVPGPVGASPTILEQSSSLWQQLHQVVLERQQRDMAKTQQLILQSKIWKDMQRLQLETKEKLQGLQWKKSLKETVHN